MAQTLMNISPSKGKRNMIMIEIDLQRWEKLAGTLGLFSDECERSFTRAERNIKEGKVKGYEKMKRK